MSGPLKFHGQESIAEIRAMGNMIIIDQERVADTARLAGDPRTPLGFPRTHNGDYLWNRHFHSALNKKGRAGFVMANSSADAHTFYSRSEHCKLSTPKQKSTSCQAFDVRERSEMKDGRQSCSRSLKRTLPIWGTLTFGTSLLV